MKTVHIRYFANIKEERGINQEELQTDCRTAAELYQQLQDAHELSLKMDSLRVSVNGAYASWDIELEDRDEIVFIPPVAGG